MKRFALTACYSLLLNEAMLLSTADVWWAEIGQGRKCERLSMTFKGNLMPRQSMADCVV